MEHAESKVFPSAERKHGTVENHCLGLRTLTCCNQDCTCRARETPTLSTIVLGGDV